MRTRAARMLAANRSALSGTRYVACLARWASLAASAEALAESAAALAAETCSSNVGIDSPGVLMGEDRIEEH